MQPRPSAPTSLDILIARAEAIAGLSLAELAEHYSIQMPKNLTREKGWVGQLIEYALGADAGSRPEPDFTKLGVELKTLPVSHLGEPLETTYICVAPRLGQSGVCWRQSLVYKKLAHVLWVPVEAERQQPLHERRIGTPLLWQPTEQQEALLQADWEELMELIALGHSISARHGEYLQLRPKAADGSVTTKAFDDQGKPIQAQPKGFYLKKTFTRMLLQQAFVTVPI
ncbi:DNA mismatch repair endonuclease MutH [Corallincola luteus]|uniref:DNA mismatch repair protein MutH n=2 Tax=Corallincola TaxID=1775176 RepID=A0A368N851_9GAMM|nr:MULTISPECIES: DNA mismatch repair endonuclease MutH [Corallincola]RCU45734.1 DNA mismatch repair endonuclease MutH [Corallincola holothuriorum]TCI02151.1 DNA mismatch repair endonuclease MutH [Corallincola luteus]